MGRKSDLYARFLREEGYSPRIDEDGDVIFKYEGMNLVLFADEDDPPYFNLYLPGFWAIESPSELQKAQRVAGEVVREMKVVKVCVNGKGTKVQASIEMFLEPIENFRPVFRRSCDLVVSAARHFGKKMS